MACAQALLLRTDPEAALWRRIAHHSFEPDHALNFTQRLARDHAWPLPYARAAIAEYARFCFLAVTAGHPVTPSEEIDEVWHLHLTYSRDYWDIWCAQILQSPLHHDPTQGGPAEQARFRQRYAATLAAYETRFGPPPAEFWPATHLRFAARPRFRTLDTRHWAVLPRPRTLWNRIGRRQ